MLSREERAVLAAWERVQQEERKECAKQRLEHRRSRRHTQVWCGATRARAGGRGRAGGCARISVRRRISAGECSTEGARASARAHGAGGVCRCALPVRESFSEPRGPPRARACPSAAGALVMPYLAAALAACAGPPGVDRQDADGAPGRARVQAH